jgi:hypothetical protein
MIIVRLLSDSDNPSQEILTIAAELEESRNPKHVRYATFHIFPRECDADVRQLLKTGVSVEKVRQQ